MVPTVKQKLKLTGEVHNGESATELATDYVTWTT